MREHKNNQRPRNIYFGKQQIKTPKAKNYPLTFSDFNNKQSKRIQASFSNGKPSPEDTSTVNTVEPSKNK